MVQRCKASVTRGIVASGQCVRPQPDAVSATVGYLVLEVADAEDGLEERAARADEGEARALHAAVEVRAVHRVPVVLVHDDGRADERGVGGVYTCGQTSSTVQ